jgi:two-component sensor histidine kinase/CheY-like chemotaxis protein
MADKKILLVENESLEAMDIKRALESFGYDVPYVASSGEEAIEKALEIMPDLILMDIVLKGDTDGIEAVSKIKDLNIPVIYLTAHSKESTIERAKLTGPYGYIIKPYDRTELKYAIELAINKNQMEKEINKSLVLAENIIATLHEPFLILNDKMIIISSNNAFYQTFKVKPKDTVGNELYQLGDGQWDIPALRELLEDILPLKKFHGYEVVHDFPQIGTKTMLLNARQVYREEIGTDLILLGIEDITERKKMEDEIKQSLDEKETLLKEIHHRVKNNLIVICSLLNLQADYVKDKASYEMFMESKNRAKSMALIHERLYQSTDLKRIDFGDYIRTLSTELFRTYAGDYGLIELKINVENIFLDINTAIPLGLIVNELITNSLKHAFPEGMKGKINVDFQQKDNHYEFTVKDNGIGFPEDLDFRNTDSLGLQIVNTLTNQIDGEIELNRSHGTEFKITFKELGL